MEFLPISEVNEDYGDVLVIRFNRDQGVILGEPPEVDFMSCIDGRFNVCDWDVFAEIDMNPAFEVAESIVLSTNLYAGLVIPDNVTHLEATKESDK